jgi:hypothetical protein
MSRGARYRKSVLGTDYMNFPFCTDLLLKVSAFIFFLSSLFCKSTAQEKGEQLYQQSHSHPASGIIKMQTRGPDIVD